jgi:hypothetical protein
VYVVVVVRSWHVCILPVVVYVAYLRAYLQAIVLVFEKTILYMMCILYLNLICDLLSCIWYNEAILCMMCILYLNLICDVLSCIWYNETSYV